MSAFALNFSRDKKGATAVEYALVAGLIGLAIIGALTGLSGKVQTLYNNIATAVK